MNSLLTLHPSGFLQLHSGGCLEIHEKTETTTRIELDAKTIERKVLDKPNQRLIADLEKPNA